MEKAALALSLLPSVFPSVDPVRQRTERGGGWASHPEADHQPSAGDAVLLPVDQPRQQRRGAAAPRHGHDGAGHPAHQAHARGQDQLRRHGHRAAAYRAHRRESQVSAWRGAWGRALCVRDACIHTHTHTHALWAFFGELGWAAYEGAVLPHIILSSYQNDSSVIYAMYSVISMPAYTQL